MLAEAQQGSKWQGLSHRRGGRMLATLIGPGGVRTASLRQAMATTRDGVVVMLLKHERKVVCP
ncbi:hypothetical protein Q427_24505 [Halomonas sp. BC04]|nr:hypothetical protein Q427_24505 [Halomonas sp. BC04]